MPTAGQVRPLILPPLNPACAYSRGLLAAYLGSAPGTYRAQDSSIYHRHANLPNSDPVTGWATAQGLGRMAVALDGANDYVDAPVTGTFVASVSFWARWDVAGTWQYACDVRTDGGLGYIARTSDNVLTASAGTKYVDGIPGIALATSTWHNVTVVGISLTIPTKIILGAKNSLNERITGGIADMCIWNRALSPSEIAALADRSNVMLEVGGEPLIWTPSFKTYFYGALAAGGATPWLYAHRRSSRVIGACA